MKLNKKLLIAAITATFAGVTQGVYAAPADKVDVCHNGHVINIAQAAVAAHLAHGDTEGACPVAVVDPAPVEPVAEEPVAEEPVAEEPVAEEPVAEEPVAEEPVAEEPVAEEPIAEDPVAEEPVAEEPIAEDPRVIEDMPPQDEIEAVVPEPTPEEIVAKLLEEATTLTESAFKDGFLSLPEVQIVTPFATVTYAVVLEATTLEDGTIKLSVAGAKEVEPREGISVAIYSLVTGEAIIPVVNVAVAPAPVEEAAPVEEVATEETASTEEVTGEAAPVEEATTEETAPAEVTEEAAPAEEATTEETVPVEEVAEETAPTIVPYYNVTLAILSADPLEFVLKYASDEPPAEEATEEAVPAEEVTEEAAPAEEATEEAAPAEEATEEAAPAEEATEEAATAEEVTEDAAPAEEEVTTEETA